MKTKISIICILWLAVIQPANAQDWLQFRGPGSAGISDKQANPPMQLDTTSHLLWKISIPEGMSSPIVHDNNLIVTGVNRTKKKYFLINIDRRRGSILWTKEINTDTLLYIHPVSSPAAATPVSDGQYVYCYFPTNGLYCFDFMGNEIWHKPLDIYPVLQGSGTSPVLCKDKILLNQDNLVNPRALAFDKKNGNVLWETKFEKVPLMNSASWSTPVFWKNQLIIHRINKIEGLDIENGERIWQFEIATTGCATPVIEGDKLFINAWMIRGENSLLGEIPDFNAFFFNNDQNKDSLLVKTEFPTRMNFSVRPDVSDIGDQLKNNRLGWWVVRYFDEDKNDTITFDEWKDLTNLMEEYTNHGLVAVHMGDTGNISFSGKIWKIGEDIAETPSLVVHNGLVYMVKDGGLISCVNSENGRIVYKEKLGAPGLYLSSPLYAGNKLYIASYNGKVSIIKAGGEFQILNQIDLKEKIGASPVTIDNILYIRTSEHLYAFW